MSKPIHWTVPDMWRGGECYVIGGGPSLGDVDLSVLRGHRVIAVNMAYARCPFADVMVFGDEPFPMLAARAAEKSKILPLTHFGGLRVTKAERNLDSALKCLVVKQDKTTMGISRDPSVSRWNHNSGGLAIQIARHLGVRRIILLGFDMRSNAKGQHNWHEHYGKRDHKFNPYKRFITALRQIAADLDAEGISCVNATPDTALDCFEVVPMESVLP